MAVLIVMAGCVTLFARSGRFVSSEVTPKWLGLWVLTGVAGAIFGVAAAVAGFRPLRSIVIDRRYIILIFRILLLLLAFQGIAQYFGWLPRHGGFPVAGSFDNPAGYAVAVALLTPFAFPENRYCVAEKIGCIVLTVLAFAALWLSGSRTGMIAAAVSLIIYIIFTVPARLRKYVFAGGFVALLAGGFFLYRLKAASADGRVLIWRCSLDLVAQKPLFGHGPGAFTAVYMPAQAAYFEAYPDSRFAQLAGNVLHPFNEYLLVAVEYGLAGLAVAVVLLWLLLRGVKTAFGAVQQRPFILSLVTMAVTACFSYPFKYPFTWFAVVAGLVHLFRHWLPCRDTLFHPQSPEIRARYAGIASGIMIVILSICSLYYTGKSLYAQLQWNDIAHRALRGDTKEALDGYEKLLPRLGNNGLFLYNYAAELHQAGNCAGSQAVFTRCLRYYNDFDVQMLMADNAQQLNDLTAAKQHLKTASAMCPSRFMPLYQLMELYRKADRMNDARTIANRLLTKEIKIPSHTIDAILNEAEKIERLKD
ncbi:MAG: O-antigen ligase family protein [Bacteroidales bacterium]|nr:O-antigen ligase family protein [Bacteroidales bacterium]